jgi:hypothetical protein
VLAVLAVATMILPDPNCRKELRFQHLIDHLSRQSSPEPRGDRPLKGQANGRRQCLIFYTPVGRRSLTDPEWCCAG